MKENQNPLGEGIIHYHQPRIASDLDMVASVREMLVASGLGKEVALHFDTNQLIQEAAMRVPEVQRHLLNRYWLLQLIGAPVPSMEPRFCLVNDGVPEEWLQLFKKSVLPFVLEYGLLRAI